MIVNERIQKLVNQYHENKFSHAFLFVTNDLGKTHQDIISLIKEISCPNKYKENCEECNLCYQIDSGVIPNIKEIYPDGQFIKKNQILELKENFKTKPLYIANNIYLINQAERLNAAAANTMLKFLEEPENNIIGFFITNNKETMLDTIKSRCQIIITNYEDENILQKVGIEAEEQDLYQNIAKEYLENNLTKSNDLIYLNKSLILNNFDDRVKITKFFNYLYLVLDKTINNEIMEEFAFLKQIKLTKLLTLQKFIYKNLETIPFNVNIELLLDNFCLEMEEL